MAKKLKNYTDHEITVILDSSSDMEDEHSESNKKNETLIKGKFLKNKRLAIRINDATDSEEVLTSNLGQSRASKRRGRTIASSSARKAQSESESESFSIDEILKTSPLRNKENKPVVTRNKRQSEVLDAIKGLHDISIIAIDKKVLKTPQKKIYLQADILETLKDSGLSTPKSLASPRISTLTPSMKKRATVLAKASTPLQQARSRLHVSVVPKSLPCREEEFNDIFRFLQGKLVDGCGGCIYISGVPGTGKTATVNEAVRCLRKLEAKQELPHFDFAEMNGMKISEPRQAYVQILKQLSGTSTTWESAYKILDKRFKTNDKKRAMTLILVDELDLLCTKRQDVVYNLLDWPTRDSARLVIITIANTMDLPERVLMGRVTSRLGLTRVTFQPYTHEQLQEIILTRLRNVDAFKSETVQLVARKVAAVSGDARRALDICRRAAEIAESNGDASVSMKNVNDALTEMVAAPKIQAIKHCSKLERIFLQSVCAEVTRTGVEESLFMNVYKQLESICLFSDIRIPSVTETLGICTRLGGSRLLICEHSRADISQRILLNVSQDNVHYALNEIDSN